MSKSRIYTRTGDTGMTSLCDGSRIEKSSALLEAYGTVDELNSVLGLLIASTPIEEADRLLLTSVQSRLFDIGGYLAAGSVEMAQELLPDLATPIAELESAIDRLDASLPPMKCFVLPQGTTAACVAHIARTVARRAERRILHPSIAPNVAPAVLQYINRLSDYLFVVARSSNHLASLPDTPWQK